MLLKFDQSDVIWRPADLLFIYSLNCPGPGPAGEGGVGGVVQSLLVWKRRKQIF